MTKKDLLKALEQYPDETEIRILRWTSSGSKYNLAVPTLNNNPEALPARFDLTAGYIEVTYNMTELENSNT